MNFTEITANTRKGNGPLKHRLICRKLSGLSGIWKLSFLKMGMNSLYYNFISDHPKPSNMPLSIIVVFFIFFQILYHLWSHHRFSIGLDHDTIITQKTALAFLFLLMKWQVLSYTFLYFFIL